MTPLPTCNLRWPSTMDMDPGCTLPLNHAGPCKVSPHIPTVWKGRKSNNALVDEFTDLVADLKVTEHSIWDTSTLPWREPAAREMVHYRTQPQPRPRANRAARRAHLRKAGGRHGH